MPTSPPADATALPLRLDSLTLTLGRGGDAATVLDLPALAIGAGEIVGLAGPSGSGKTLLLHLFAGLRRPSTGAVHWGGTALTGMADGARDAWRRGTVGMVFQDFHLIPELSALDNVLLPAWFAAVSATPWRAAAQSLLDAVGIASPARRAGALSRGEQQRVAVARALLFRPALILADEPTASLDAASAEAVTRLLLDHARATGATLIAASHDPALLGQLDRTLHLQRGRLA